MRGIIPASVLASLEKHLLDTRGQETRAGEIFDFVAGTSTGAIIATGVAAGLPAPMLLDLYESRGKDVFPERWFLFRALQKVLLGYMFSSKKLRQVLAEESEAAELWNIKEQPKINASPIDIMITGKRVSDGMPWYFVKDNVKNKGRTGKLPILDCVTRSAAVPTYFQPWEVPEPHLLPGEDPVGRLTDGGVGVAGNPVYQACVEAFHYTADKTTDGRIVPRYSPEGTIVVSLGTGSSSSYADPGWAGDWLFWVLDELLNSANEQQTDLVRRHFSEATFYRIDPKLDHSIPGNSAKNIPELLDIGRKFAATIEWEPILKGEDSPFLIGDKTLRRDYAKPVPG